MNVSREVIVHIVASCDPSVPEMPKLERAFVEPQWEWDYRNEYLPKPRQWSALNINQHIALAAGNDVHFSAVVPGVHKFFVCNIYAHPDQSDYLRLRHIGRLHDDVLVRRIPLGGRINLQIEVINRVKIAEVNAYTLSGEKKFEYIVPHNRKLTASELKFRIQQHLLNTDANFSPNVQVHMMMLNSERPEIRGNITIADTRKFRGGSKQSLITNFFKERT
jgi:hypothetical protein